MLDPANLPARRGTLQSLPLCVIEAVFSINSRYEATDNTVQRFCQAVNIPWRGPQRRPPIADQFSTVDLLQLYSQHTAQHLAVHVYGNEQMTSSRNGILKSEAVRQFAEACRRFNLDYLQDFDVVRDFAQFEAAIQQIRGQRSGVSVRYFYMLAGDDNFVKPDRMVRRFVQSAIGRWPTVQEAHDGVVGAQELLVHRYPHLAPKLLDNLIWRYQRVH